jgi:hypothetical protein
MYRGLPSEPGESMTMLTLGTTLSAGFVLTSVATIRGVFPAWIGYMLLAAAAGSSFSSSRPSSCRHPRAVSAVSSSGRSRANLSLYLPFLMSMQALRNGDGFLYLHPGNAIPGTARLVGYKKHTK